MSHVQSIPLSKLAPSPLNAPRIEKKVAVEELAASIEAHDLLQGLTVVEVGDARYQVSAGGRRLAALKLLAKRKVIPADFAVPCSIVPANILFYRFSFVSCENEKISTLFPSGSEKRKKRNGPSVTIPGFSIRSGAIAFTRLKADSMSTTRIYGRTLPPRAEPGAYTARSTIPKSPPATSKPTSAGVLICGTSSKSAS
jgi:hypothetical protein